MKSNKTELLDEVARYYSDKLAEHGETPRGVDWNSEEAQMVRFEQLCKIVDAKSDAFSVNDLGCGYGALLEYLVPRYSLSSYLGVDVSEDMVSSARVRHQACSRARFEVGAKPKTKATYGVASGIFNVRLGRTNPEWLDYVKATLETLNHTSERGFAFNCTTSYSDEDKKRDYLFYADPCHLFDFCKRRFSRQVALLHDYGLYEFTILVRKI
jgi:SAM-dependent methyltransferase